MKDTNYRIMKIAALADILEAEIKGLNPVKNFNNIVGVSKLVALESKCTSVRSFFDEAYGKGAYEAGGIYDRIDKAIEVEIKKFRNETKG